MNFLTFSKLRQTNATRLIRWHGSNDVWTGADWSNAMCGEAGEVANVIKKIRRHETGLGDSANTPPMDELIQNLEAELADVIIYADLLADFYGINLEDAIKEKFNHTSKINGFPERL